ncbi:hypothetical protein DPMN_164405 [Dreissena polymorpha]|uniref:Fibronectin type-III domain-containing protein n=1 Tax=Dreissena polymorpha TaxID=45954 RepID=A0A9D4EV68_DREPO|nr:hypothetical protein DPMN_164405 [Dreissena polymorpha]
MVVVMLGKPGPVKNLQGSPESKKIKVEWTSPEDPGDDPESLHYRVSCQGEGYDEPPGISKETEETEWTFDKLTPMMKYVVTVYAINSVGESQPSTIHITTKPEQVEDGQNTVTARKSAHHFYAQKVGPYATDVSALSHYVLLWCANRK